MNQIQTTGIILARTDFGEADRIITVLTPEYGKLRLMAKGVRRVKSKLAGGIELFSVSHLSYIKGRGDIGRLVSARLDRHYGHIVQDIDRTMLGYELIKRLNKVTEDEAEVAYFSLLDQAFGALDGVDMPVLLIELWFTMQLLRIGGHTPNLSTTLEGVALRADGRYAFDAEAMTFRDAVDGPFTARHIKLLRFGFGEYAAALLGKIEGSLALGHELAPIVRAMGSAQLRI